MRSPALSCFVLLLFVPLSGCCPRRPGVSLLEAVKEGDLEKTKAHFFWGSDADLRDRQGKSPLHLAAAAGHADLTAYLLAVGADPSARDLHGWTPLLDAATQDDLAVASTLLRHGAEVGARDNYGRTALFWAVRRDDRRLAELLLDHGASGTALDRQGLSPIVWALQLRHREMARLLVSRMKAGEVEEEHGSTPLHFAVLLGDEELVRALVGRGADVNAADRHGDTPTRFAERDGHERILRFLLSRGGQLRRPADPIESQARSAPDWVNRGSGMAVDDRGRGFYGVGLASGIENVALARQTADNRARAELLKLFHVYIAQAVKELNDQPRQRGKKKRNVDAVHVQKTFTQGELQGAQIVDHWLDPADGTLYALAYLDLADARRQLSGKKDLHKQLRAYVARQGERLFDELQSTTVVDTLESLLNQARADKDIIRLNCLNEKLVLAKGLVQIQLQARQETGSPDAEEAEHARKKIGIAQEKLTSLLQEARACTGEITLPAGTTRVEIERE